MRRLGAAGGARARARAGAASAGNTAAARRKRIVALLLLALVLAGGEPPQPMAWQCSYRTISLRRNVSHVFEDHHRPFLAAHVRIFFDQPLFLNGVRSLERIYAKGKLADIDRSVADTMRLCCGTRCFRSGRAGFEHDTEDDAEALVSRHVEFLANPADLRARGGSEGEDLVRALFHDTSIRPGANELHALYVTDDPSEVASPFATCSLDVRADEATGRVPFANLNNETIGPGTWNTSCRAARASRVRMWDRGRKLWDMFNEEATSFHSQDAEGPVSFLQVAQGLRAGILRGRARRRAHAALEDLVPAFIDEAEPHVFRSRASLSWQRRAQLRRAYQGAGDGETQAGGASLLELSQARPKASDVDDETGVTYERLGNRCHMDVKTHHVVCDPETPSGGGSAERGNGDGEDDVEIDPETGMPVPKKKKKKPASDQSQEADDDADERAASSGLVGRQGKLTTADTRVMQAIEKQLNQGRVRTKEGKVAAEFLPSEEKDFPPLSEMPDDEPREPPAVEELNAHGFEVDPDIVVPPPIDHQIDDPSSRSRLGRSLRMPPSFPPGPGVATEPGAGGGGGGEPSVPAEEPEAPPPAETGYEAGIEVEDSFGSWCDLTDPFGNPFCPFPPILFIFFNILIKIMVPGLIGPIIDTASEEFMQGQDASIKLAANILLELDSQVKAGNASAQQIVGDRTRLASLVKERISALNASTRSAKELSPELLNARFADLDRRMTDRFFAALNARSSPDKPIPILLQQVRQRVANVAVDRRSLLPPDHKPLGQEFADRFTEMLVGSSALLEESPYQRPDPPVPVIPPPGKGKALVPMLKMALYMALVHPLTICLAHQITHKLTLAVTPPLFDSLVDGLKEYLEKSLTHALTHTITNTLPLTVGTTVPETIESVMPVHLIIELTTSLTNTLTRSMTHTLSSSLIQTLGRSPEVEYYCYYCGEQKRYCDECLSLGRKADTYFALYYAQFLSSYYGDYYSNKFAHDIYRIMREEPEKDPPSK